MASKANAVGLSKFKISRRGRKLQISDDPRFLLALPKDVPERTWAEVLQKEERDLFIFDIREEILEEALRIGYEHYMQRMVAPFAVHCAAEAWMKIIDWYFYRHDPGEDPSAQPLCYIPNREESWIPDELPDPSPKDSWARHDLVVIENTPDERLKKSSSASSLDYPVVEDIPEQYRFPGKVSGISVTDSESCSEQGTYEQAKYEQDEESSTVTSSGDLAADSEVLQKVTDYSSEDKESSVVAVRTETSASLLGAGDSAADRLRPRRQRQSKVLSKPSVSGRSRAQLAPLGGSRSRVSAISDCRLRSLRLDTQYEISSEKVETPQGEQMKRK